MEPRIAIIGAGNLSTRRIYPYIGAAGAQLVGTCDFNLEKARQNAQRFGGAAYDNFETMVDIEKPDGVMICVEGKVHAEIASMLIERGIPVYTEKPPAESAAAALVLARKAAQHQVLCMTAFKKRHSTAFSRAREWLNGFPAADRLALSVDYCSGHYSNETPRRDFLLDFCVHAIDVTTYLFGEVATVFALTQDKHAYSVSLRFTSGAVGSLCFADGRSFQVPTEEYELTLKGGNFMTIHNSSQWKITQDGKPCEWREPNTFVSGGDSGMDTGHLAEIIDFVDAIKENRRTSCSSIAESYKSMVLYEAIAASAKSGEIIKIQYETV